MKFRKTLRKWSQAFRTALAIIITCLFLWVLAKQLMVYGFKIGQKSCPKTETATYLEYGLVYPDRRYILP